MFLLPIALISATFAETIPSSWNQTITENGIPAFRDIRSKSYIPDAVRANGIQFSGTLDKRDSDDGKDTLEWSATLSEERVKVEEYAYTSSKCTEYCNPPHTLPNDLFSQVVGNLDSKCSGTTGCFNDFVTEIAGKKVHVSVNGKYSSGKETYITAIQKLEAANSKSELERRGYKRHFTPKGGRCTSAHCSNYKVISTSRRYSFALYYKTVAGDPTSGGYHSSLDIEIHPEQDVVNTNSMCNDIAGVVTTIATAASKAFGAVAKVGSVILCTFVFQ
jgi:hypothetical protein